MIVKKISLDVCSDCQDRLSFGDEDTLNYYYESKGDQKRAWIDHCIDATIKKYNGHFVEADISEFEQGFTWRPCELCHSTLGGHRFRFHLIGEQN